MCPLNTSVSPSRDQTCTSCSHQRVNEVVIRDPYDDAADEDDPPAEDVLQQVPRQDPFVQTRPPSEPEEGGCVEEHAHHREAHHAAGVNVLWMDQSWYRFGEHKQGARRQHNCAEKGSEKRQSLVSKGSPGIRGFCSAPFGEPRGNQGDAVAQVVQRIREDSQAVGPQTPSKFDQGETNVQNEGCAYVLLAGVVVLCVHLWNDLDYDSFLSSEGRGTGAHLASFRYTPRTCANCTTNEIVHNLPGNTNAPR